MLDANSIMQPGTLQGKAWVGEKICIAGWHWRIHVWADGHAYTVDDLLDSQIDVRPDSYWVER